MDIAVCFCILDSIKTSTFFDLIQVLPSIKDVYGTTGCLLPASRNQTIQNLFNKLDEYSHILFIDSDICGFNTETINKLVDEEKDIISPTMTRREPPFFPVHSYLPKAPISSLEDFILLMKLPQEERPVFQSRSVGMGFTLIKSEIFKKISAPWFHHDRRPRKTFPAERDKFISDVFPLEVDKKEYAKEDIAAIIDKAIKLGRICHKGTFLIGEDVGFCDEARRFGFTSWVHSGIYLSHIGETKYNLGDTLAFLENPELQSRVEQMTYVWRKNG